MAAGAPPPAAIERPPQLGISPTRLNFQCPPPLPPRPPLTHPSPTPTRAGTHEEPGELLRLRLTNRSSDRAAMYKVKTTAPKRYRVNPNAAEIEPGATVEVKGALPIPTPPPRR